MLTFEQRASEHLSTSLYVLPAYGWPPGGGRPCRVCQPSADGRGRLPASGSANRQMWKRSELDPGRQSGPTHSKENTSANLDWNQTPYYFRMLISGPFGGGRSVLEGREGRFSLTTSEGRFEAETPEALMEEKLGWSLPVRAMPDWVRGLPGDHASYQLETDELGFPSHLQQDGWEIDYRDWEQAEGMWLPRRLVMNYGDVRITLVVNQWQASE